MSVKSVALLTFALVIALVAPVQSGPLEEAIQKYESGDLQAAHATLQPMLEANPDDPEVRYYLGRTFLGLGELDAAIKHFKKAVDLQQSSAQYQLWLGRAYIQKLQTVSYMEKGMLSGRALESFKKATKLDPANVDAKISLASYYLNAPSIAGGSKKKAREQIDAIIVLDPLSGNTLQAQLLVAQEKYDEAIDCLNICLELEPDNTGHRYQLAMVYQKREDFDRATQEFDSILAVDPEDRGALYQVARTAVFSGDNADRGIECLDTYLTLEVLPGTPQYDSAHWRRGMLFESKGDISKARQDYELALQINPQNKECAKSLASLDGD